MAKTNKNKATGPASTPAPKKDQVFGSSKNKPDSARSTSSGRSIEISQDIVRALQTKMRIHNKKMKELGKDSSAMASLGMLKSVFRRGAGAYSISHRPGMTRNQWAYGRVNAFLRMLEKGKPTNLRYVGDSDLLPEGHPWKNRNAKSDDPTEIKALGRKLRRIGRMTSESFDPNAIDADSDMIIQEGTQFERPAPPRLTRATTQRVTGAAGPGGKEYDILNAKRWEDLSQDERERFAGWAKQRNNKLEGIIQLHIAAASNPPKKIPERSIKDMTDARTTINAKNSDKTVIDKLWAQGWSIFKVGEEARAYSPITGKSVTFSGKLKDRGLWESDLNIEGWLNEPLYRNLTRNETFALFGAAFAGNKNEIDKYLLQNDLSEFHSLLTKRDQQPNLLDENWDDVQELLRTIPPAEFNIDEAAQVLQELYPSDMTSEEFKDNLVAKISDEPSLIAWTKSRGQVGKNRVSGSMSAGGPDIDPPSDPDPWDADEELERLSEDEIEGITRGFEEMLEGEANAAELSNLGNFDDKAEFQARRALGDLNEFEQQVVDTFVERYGESASIADLSDDDWNALLNETLTKSKPTEADWEEYIKQIDVFGETYENFDYYDTEWLDDQAERYAPKPPEVGDPSRIKWESIFDAVGEYEDGRDLTYWQWHKERSDKAKQRYKDRQAWIADTDEAKAKRDKLWKQFTSEDIYLQELADQENTPRSTLREALRIAAIDDGLDGSDFERAMSASERSWRRRRDEYDKNKALNEIDAEIDALGASVPKSIREIDRRLDSLQRKLRAIRDARKQTSAEYQGFRREYARLTAIGQMLYGTKPERKPNEAAESYARRLYEWAQETQPHFLYIADRSTELADRGTGTRSLFNQQSTQVEAVRQEITRLEAMRERAQARADGAVRALTPAEFRKVLQDKKKAEDALKSNPLYRRFVRGSMSVGKKPMASTAARKTSGLGKQEREVLAYLDGIAGVSASSSTPRRVSGSMTSTPRYKPSTRVRRLLGIPDELPSGYSDVDYAGRVETLNKYGRGGRLVTDQRYASVWTPIINAITKSVTRRKKKDGDNKVARILGGAPGTGKSTMREKGFNGIPSRERAAHVDVDEIKTLLPEYNGYVSRDLAHMAASSVHEESRNLSFAVINNAISQGIDIVFDSSGQFNNDPGTLMRLRTAGYSIVGDYFVGPIDVLDARVAQRAKNTGRVVPLSYTSIIQGRLRSVMAENMSDYSDFTLWLTQNDADPIPIFIMRDGDILITAEASKYIDLGRMRNKGWQIPSPEDDISYAI